MCWGGVTWRSGFLVGGRRIQVSPLDADDGWFSYWWEDDDGIA